MKRNPPVRACTPALLTGTSTEYLGRKPWPRVIRERQVTFVLGAEGVGKTSVARRIAGERALYLDTCALQHAALERIRRGSWSEDLRTAPALVLDGPVWLRHRQGLVEILVELLQLRSRGRCPGYGNGRRRTVVCQSDNDGSVETLIGAMEAGSIVVVGLRFPKGKRGRLRYARRVCDELGIPREAARGTEHLEPWDYDLVADYLSRWPATDLPARPDASRACGCEPGCDVPPGDNGSIPE